MDWQARNEVTPERTRLARSILQAIQAGASFERAVRRYPQADGGLVSKVVLVHTYRQMIAEGELPESAEFLARIRMKPVRSLSGVSTVTVLTKHHPCPGKCIFCPDDARMPKSYLADEPGAMRGLQNEFDPYRQVASRLESLDAIGHPTAKIELLILGGSWSAYPREYQEDFILRCLEALNTRPSKTIAQAQQRNETAPHRLVGLVIETRPDDINAEEIANLRRLGVTKVQMGAQSMDDAILRRNRRGHSAAQTLAACTLLRAAGFKIVLHWMANLLGATPQSDRKDFARLYSSGAAPDEIKIYPCQLLAGTVLHTAWERGKYQPYSTETLISLIAEIKTAIPRYSRVNRIIRDIPSPHVIEGNRRTSLRGDIQAYMQEHGLVCRCIRCREVRGEPVEPEKLILEDLQYRAGDASEHFLQLLTPTGKLAAYLRLSLPTLEHEPLHALLPDLRGAALIREVHVYGQALAVGKERPGVAQHAGLGSRLLQEAETRARAAGFTNLAVIASVGTRRYYQARGYTLQHTYMVKRLLP